MSSSPSHKCVSITAGISLPAKINQVDLSRLPVALARAVREGWQIAPVSAHSKFASVTRSCLAAPSSDPALIASRSVQFPEANWCVRTGRTSNLVILELDHETGQESLCDLCCDQWDWTDTLRFNDDLATSFLFRYPVQRLRHLSSEIQGLQVHAGNLVLLPPCWFAAGAPLVYSDLNVDVLECPPFLLHSEFSQRNSARVIPFPPNMSL